MPEFREELDLVAEDAWDRLAKRAKVKHVVEYGGELPPPYSGYQPVLLRGKARFRIGWMPWRALANPVDHLARIEGSVSDDGSRCTVEMQVAGYWDPLARSREVMPLEPWIVLLVILDPVGWALLGGWYVLVMVAVLGFVGVQYGVWALSACLSGRKRVLRRFLAPVASELRGQRALPARVYR